MNVPLYRILGHYVSDDISHPRQFLRNWFRIFGEHGDEYPVVLTNACYWTRISQKPWIGLNNFERFLESISSRKALFDFLEQYPSAFEILWGALSNAQHLAKILIRNPEDFYWLLEGSSLGQPMTAGELFRKFDETVFRFQSPYRQISFLHRLHRRHFLRIAMRDLLGIAGFEQTVTDLSYLAETLVQMATKFVLQSLEDKQKLPDSRFAVIALGKLGGRELNYSSDIDLMFVYEHDGTLPNGENYSTIFQRAAEEICRILNEQSEHGVLYRVDTRLRPDGVSGILCQSLSAYLHYYENRGRLWERQMLIKARPVAGDLELGQSALDRFEPFIYPRRIRYPLKDIVVHRKKSETRTEEGLNVKTDPGGIRDIEFIVQALQLQFGGLESSIREQNTLAALRKLAIDEKFLSTREAEQLKEKYIFLREVEHILQLQENLQIHVLPVREPKQTLIHALLDYQDYASLYRDTEVVMQSVRRLFRSIFETNGLAAEEDYSTYSRSDWESLFEERGFRNPQKAAHEFQALATGRFPNNHDSYTREAFWKMCPHLLKIIQNTPAPADTLTDFERIIRTYTAVRSLYELFAAEPGILQLILNLISRAPKIVPWIVQQPALVDLLIGLPDEILTGTDLEHRYEPLSNRKIPEDQWLQKAIDLHHEVIVTILAQWITKEISLPELYEIFSTASTNLLQRSLDYWMEELRDRMAVIIAGSGAAQTMVFSSDYDILFILSPDQDNTQATSTVEKYIRHMQEYTSHGRLFSFDFRLRPEGRSSPLVMPEDKYETYVDKRMSPWEFQAMGKSSFLWGEESLWQRITHYLNTAIHSRIGSHDFWERLMTLEKEAIRQKFRKLGKDYVYHQGGLFTVRNTLEWSHLINTYSDASSRMPELNRIRAVFQWFQQIRWYLSLHVSGSVDSLPNSREKLDIIGQHLGFADAIGFTQKIDALLSEGQQLNDRFREWLGDEF